MTANVERLAGKRALISGASSGVAEATAKRLVDEGVSVGLIARRGDLLERLAGSLGAAAMPLVADVSDDVAVSRVVSQYVDRFGGVDIVINAAAIDGPAPLQDLTPEVWRQQIDVNLSGSFYLAREAALHMIKGDGGVILNFGSELGLIGMPMFVHYCASKFGIIGLTKALAAELAPKIRVNCICPGPINTPMMTAELEWFDDPAAAREGAIARVPLKRFAEVDEIVTAAMFFINDATYATGSIFSLDGGTTAI